MLKPLRKGRVTIGVGGMDSSAFCSVPPSLSPLAITAQAPTPQPLAWISPSQPPIRLCRQIERTIASELVQLLADYELWVRTKGRQGGRGASARSSGRGRATAPNQGRPNTRLGGPVRTGTAEASSIRRSFSTGDRGQVHIRFF